MGDMADMFLQAVVDMEYARDEYANGDMSMQDAFDTDFIDSMGVEQEGIQEAHDRNELLDAKGIDKALEREVDKFNLAQPICKRPILNAKAITNLNNAVPTCNICNKLMHQREGKFGRFYFCYCPAQTTVSDKYWQSIRKQANEDKIAAYC